MNKLDLINLLEEACGGRCNAEYNPCAYKEAARELRALKPVAWGSVKESFCGFPKVVISQTKKDNYVPLYVLDEVKE